MLFPLGAVFSPSLEATDFLLLSSFFAGSTLLVFQAARRGDRESGIVARGFLFLIACLLADLLKELRLLPTPPGLPILGFMAFFLTSAYSLNEGFGREEEASRTDSLTGLKNRRGFSEACEGELHRIRRSGQPVAVVLADLDHFKKVNDTLGHAAGDEVLRRVAQACRAALRAQDTVGRWGGEEFIFLLPGTDFAGAVQVAEKLRRMVDNLSIAGKQWKLTLSLGVAAYRPGTDFEETISRAARAL